MVIVFLYIVRLPVCLPVCSSFCAYPTSTRAATQSSDGTRQPSCMRVKTSKSTTAQHAMNNEQKGSDNQNSKQRKERKSKVFQMSR
ncbi:hypothetical protein B0T17DRAFT_515452 [Bombardia bombarda]|uniref:Secreted protein n=1 Tax=Bombardia bombarda TaxID=252184 RepID=A0AA39XJF9_9PEZI|nr:hypothetical protein B0T17DRAFT_515452 [Bombardia bombarda]